LQFPLDEVQRRLDIFVPRLCAVRGSHGKPQAGRGAFDTVGQKAKYSLRAIIVRYCPDNGPSLITTACPKSANSGSELLAIDDAPAGASTANCGDAPSIQRALGLITPGDCAKPNFYQPCGGTQMVAAWKSDTLRQRVYFDRQYAWPGGRYEAQFDLSPSSHFPSDGRKTSDSAGFGVIDCRYVETDELRSQGSGDGQK